MSIRRGRSWLFRDLDMSINPGHLLWIQGANGSGKTSLLRVLVGLSRPDTGEIRHGTVASEIVYIGHNTGLKEDLSAAEALLFLSRLHGKSNVPGEANAALKRLSVEFLAHRSVRTLSQGQRRRVALARLSLSHSPALWVLDEPFDSLDPEGVAIVLQLIHEHLNRGGGVVLTSHLPFDVTGLQIQTINLDARSAAHA